jgi:hypothetical protein
MGSKIAKFPIFSGVIREFDRREWFASDCVIRHSVCTSTDSPPVKALNEWGWAEAWFSTNQTLKH